MAGKIETGNQGGLIYDSSEVVVGLAENKKATFIEKSLFCFQIFQKFFQVIIPSPKYCENLVADPDHHDPAI